MIKIGGSSVAAVKLGDKTVSKMYIGGTLVYEVATAPTSTPVVFVDAGTVITNLINTFNVPYATTTPIQAGDLLMVFIYIRAIDMAPVAPSGWTDISQSSGTETMGKLYVYYKIAAGGETGTVTWTYGGSSGSISCRMLKFRGNRTTGTIIDKTGEAIVKTVNPVTQPTSPVVNTNDLALWVVGISNDTAPSSGNVDTGTWSWPIRNTAMSWTSSQGSDNQVNIRTATANGTTISGFTYTFTHTAGDEHQSMVFVIKAN